MTRDTVILAALLALASPAALAGDADSEKATSDENGRTFSQWDLNNDGEIEEAEILEAQNAAEGFNWGAVEFEEMDQDDDNVVTREEWQEFFQA